MRLHRPSSGLLTALLLAAALAVVRPAGTARGAEPLLPPLSAKILDAKQQPVGEARVYPNFVELVGPDGQQRGAIGVVMAQGRVQLFLVRADTQRRLIGWAEAHRLYNSKAELVGYYTWTPIWSYVYDPKMNQVGRAQCLAYQGVCAAGIAGYLLGLL